MIDAEHDVVVVTAPLWAFADPYVHLAPNIDQFRASMPADYRHLLLGPATSAANGFLTWVFAPDGHHEDQEDAVATVAALRARFTALWAVDYPHGMQPFAVVHLRYGGERPPGYRASIEYAQV